jgi:glycosyltransferase involved in cell wall biosynthesis
VAPDPGLGDGSGDYALFVGRLGPEKGLDTLLEAWRTHRPAMRLRILGSGPLEAEVAAAAAAVPEIAYDGFRQRSDVLDLIGRAAMVIVPSKGQEPFGLVAIEALARGTPVVAARVGSLPDLVDDGRTGRLFAPGDAADLAASVGWVWQNRHGLRPVARAAYLASYTGEANYRMLAAIYQRALGSRAPARQVAAFEAAT